jgi:phosphate transport system substrate-binding protein
VVAVRRIDFSRCFNRNHTVKKQHIETRYHINTHPRRKQMRKAIVFAVVAAVLGAGGAQAQQRDSISVVGSSTVYPFATVVAEKFGKSGGFKTPKIESTGTGGGFKLFCSGVGVQHPDISNASRAIKASEFEACDKNGVTEIVEVKIGYDGIVLASSKKGPELKLTTRDIFLALAKEVPDPKGGDALVANPYKTWKDVNAALPDAKIEVLGPPPTSGTRDAFLELAMEPGALKFEGLKKISKDDSKKFQKIFSSVREDGAYIDAGENDNLIVQKLLANPNSVGIFGFSFLDQNTDKIRGALVEGAQPAFESIASGKYPLSRPLFFYVKKAHVGVVPGIQEYLAEFTSEKAWGKDGYLSEKGLIPLPDAERKQVAEAVKTLKPLADVK